MNLYGQAAHIRGPAADTAARPCKLLRGLALSGLLGLAQAASATLCGDALLDPMEACDDGNTADGDGCSALCEVEDGFECTPPVPPDFGTNVVLEPGFEPGTPSAAWTESSSNFSTPICSPLTCSLSGAYEGDWWAWFGGSNSPESGSLEQSIVIPASANELRFQLYQQRCDGPDDYLSVLIDGSEILRIAPCTPGTGYELQVSDISAFADDGAHLMRFEAETFAGNGGASNMFVDAVHIYDNIDGTPPQPGICTAAPDTCLEFGFGASGTGDLTDWTVFNTGPVSLDWGTTDDGFCGSGSLGEGAPAPNVTGGAGEAACVDTDANGFGEVESWLCSPLLDYSLALSPQLRFLYNYQVFASPDGGDLFELLSGTAPPDPVSVLGYDSLLATSDNAGTLLGLPGVEARLDLSPDSRHICFHYRGNFDYYAQVDEIRLLAAICDLTADPDADGVANAQDNCTEVANAAQRDTDLDGFGNVCDADLNDDCVINFLDLAEMKLSFFLVGDLDSDLDGDGHTNFGDLVLLKNRFFLPPGPSGLSDCEPGPGRPAASTRNERRGHP